MQPAVDERLGGLLRLVPVAGDDVLAADQQLADARQPGRRRAGRPRRAARRSRRSPAAAPQYSSGRNVDTDDVSVSPKPLPSRAFGNDVRSRAITSGRRRRAAVGDPADVAHVEVGEVRLVHRQPEDRRHRGEHVDLLVDDRPQEGLHLERRHDHRRAAQWSVMSNWLLQPVTWNSGTETRLRMLRSSGKSDDPPARLAVRQEVLVGGHRALREARRAAGVEDRRQRLVVERRRRRTARRRAAASPGAARPRRPESVTT